MSHVDFSKALQDGTKLSGVFKGDDGYYIREATLALVPAGDLILTSGEIIACDPRQYYGDFEDSALTIKVSPGRYPVILSVACFQDNGEQYIAFATLLFRNGVPAVKWDMATRSGEDVNLLEMGEAYRYGVDSGVGCYMDADIAKILIDAGEKKNKEFYFKIREAVQKRNTHLEPVNVSINNGANIVAFTSGFGDGAYACYFGYDKDNEVVCLLTDFDVFFPEEDLKYFE